MSVNGISNVTTNVPTANTSNETTASKSASSSDSNKTSNDSGVIYESSSKTSGKKTNYADPDLVAKLKAATEARTAQLQSLVEKMMLEQSSKHTDIWKALSSGTLKADAATISQAKADIGEDGYWGVEQTSDRILSFAKALAGDDPAKIEKMRAAFEKGYGQATKAWGKELPGISKDTYDAVMKKFDNWASESEAK